jgi:hypothetical protein
LNTASLNLPNIVGIKSYYQDIHWELKVESGSYSGAEAVRLGLNEKTATFYSEDGGGDAIIAEVDVNNNVLSLGGQGTSGFVVSTTEKPSSKASKYVLAKSDKISVSITRYITPNALDDKNNVLFIQNIEFFPINTVTLIDRWGVPIKTWKNFANYTSSDAVQNDFDFTKLSVGNYVCSLNYTDLDGKQQKVLQMISVVK